MSQKLCLPKPRRPRPSAGLAVLGVLALAVLAAATAWLHLGWRPNVDLTLVDEIADASQLQGFTLSGAMAWSGSLDRVRFSLQDGELHTELRLDDPDAVRRQTENYTLQTLAVRPQDRDAVNEAARVSQTMSNGTRILLSETAALRRMHTLQLPDGTSLRLAGGDLTLEEPAEVRAEDPVLPPDVTESPLGTYYDYHCTDLTTPDSFPVWTPVNPQPFVLGTGYGVCWTQDFLGRAPGLYRAHGLTADEIYALPADGLRYDKEILCATTEFGTLEPFYCPDDAQLALAGVSMADGSTLLLYYRNDGMLCADLINAAGRCTDHRELTELPGMTRIDATLMPRTRSQDAVLLVTPYEGQDQNGVWHGGESLLVLLRAEEGRFALADTMDPEYQGSLNAALLSEAGDKLLLATERNVVLAEGDMTLMSASANRISLRVYELDTGHMTYGGAIETGSPPAWGTRIAVRTAQYDTLQQDGGNLP